MPRVYNKKYNDAPPGAVYIGRPSKHGNQWTHIQNGNHIAEFVVPTVEDSIRCYGEWLFKLFKDFHAFDAYVEGLEGKDLICWCAPKGGVGINDHGPDICHGQMLGRLVEVHFAVRDLVLEEMARANHNS